MHLSDIPIPIPVRRAPISAKWAGDITRAINARRLIAGKGIRLTKSPNGTIVEATAVSFAAGAMLSHLLPFTCRYATMDETGEYDGWEIFLPAGCVTIGASHKPMNPPARRKKSGSNGNDVIEDVPSWYRLGIFTQNGSDTQYLTAKTVDGKTVMQDVFTVTIHAKRYSAMEGVDEFEKFPVRYFFADATSRNAPGNLKDSYSGDWGDTFSAEVGCLEIEEAPDGENATRYVRTSVNSAHGPIYAEFSADTGGFDLIHSLTMASPSNNPSIIGDKLYMTNRALNAAGVTLVANDIFDLETSIAVGDGAITSVYLKIDTTKIPYEGTVLTYRKTEQGGTAGGNGGELTEDEFIVQNKSMTDIMVLIFRMQGGRIMLDNRRSLNNLQVYM